MSLHNFCVRAPLRELPDMKTEHKIIIIIIIIASSYIALFKTEGPHKALYRYIYYYPGHRIQA